MRYIFFFLLLSLNVSLTCCMKTDRQKLLQKQKEKLQEKIEREVRLRKIEQRVQDLESDSKQKEIEILRLRIAEEERKKAQILSVQNTETEKSDPLKIAKDFLQNEVLAFAASESSLYLVNKFGGESQEPTIQKRCINFLAARGILEIGRRMGPANCMFTGCGLLLVAYLSTEVKSQGTMLEFFDTEDLIPGCAACNYL